MYCLSLGPLVLLVVLHLVNSSVPQKTASFLLWLPLSDSLTLLTSLPVGRIELRVLGTIPEGEELTVSYIDFLKLSKDRQQLLKKQYYFDCKCEHCSKGIKDDLMMATKTDEKVG